MLTRKQHPLLIFSFFLFLSSPFFQEAFSEVQDTNECPKTKFDRDMRMFEFYGYPPSWFTDEIHGILNDEFLESVEAMKEKMIKV